MTVVARHVTVRGRVQGVFFRAWAAETARSRGLTGWVRNRENGTVEVVVQGNPDTVEHFLTLLWQGPPAARVDGVDVRDEEVGSLIGFEQRETL